VTRQQKANCQHPPVSMPSAGRIGLARASVTADELVYQTHISRTTSRPSIELYLRRRALPHSLKWRGGEAHSNGAGGSYVSIRPEIRLSLVAYSRLWLRAKWARHSIGRAISTILRDELLQER